MKTKILSYLAIILSLAIWANADPAQAAEAGITKTKTVEASADKVWSLLRQMDDVDRYSSAIATVEWKGNHGIGGERTCYGPDGNGFYKEKIVAFSDATRSYGYLVTEGVPVVGMANQFRVVDLGYNRSMIIWTTKYEAFMENPNMNEEQFLMFLHQTVDEMFLNVANASIQS